MLWRHPRVSIAFPNGEQADGEVRGIDGGTDLAVVTFAGVTVAVAERSPAPMPRVGDAVFAVGRDPSGLMHASFGHVGAVGGEWRTWRGGRLEQLIRLDGGLPPGLVGAPIADAAGRLLGIASHSFSRHHAVVVPVATIERVLDPLLTHGRLPQGYLGIAVQARARDDGRDRRRRPAGHVAGGRRPAARGGLLVGDVIVTLAGQPASSLDALRSHLQVGATVQAVIVRGGQRQELAIDVIQRPSSFCG
jgi:S1-C subfamily serine protease